MDDADDDIFGDDGSLDELWETVEQIEVDEDDEIAALLEAIL